jgi:hypothetical protein
MSPNLLFGVVDVRKDDERQFWLPRVYSKWLEFGRHRLELGDVVFHGNLKSNSH